MFDANELNAKKLVELRKIAKSLQIDFYTSSRIDAKIKELEEELALETAAKQK